MLKTGLQDVNIYEMEILYIYDLSKTFPVSSQAQQYFRWKIEFIS